MLIILLVHSKEAEPTERRSQADPGNEGNRASKSFSRLQFGRGDGECAGAGVGEVAIAGGVAGCDRWLRWRLRAI
jgi:hypothetical protein